MSRRRRVLLSVVLVVVLLLAYPGWLAWRIWDRSHTDETRPADAIVVLGAAQYNGRPSPVFQARLDHAAYLYGEGLSPTIIVTGGKRPGDSFSEAEAGHSYLEDQGVPEGAILEETQGRTTLESMEAVKRIAEDEDITTVLLVSDPLHSERIERIADDLGFEETYTSWASYTQLERSRLTKAKQLLREVGSLLVYELLGR